MRLLANLDAYGRPVRLVTITAPGAAVLPWSESDPGRVQAGARWAWNRTAPARWRRLHRLSAQRVRRRGLRFSILARAWQYQRRGVLHMHVVVPNDTLAERRAADLYVRELHALARDHGFGFVDRKRQVREAAHAARYLASYLAGSASKGHQQLSETVRQQDVPPLVVFVARSLTAQTRVIMWALWLWWLAWVLGWERGISWVVALHALLELHVDEVVPRWLRCGDLAAAAAAIG